MTANGLPVLESSDSSQTLSYRIKRYKKVFTVRNRDLAVVIPVEKENSLINLPSQDWISRDTDRRNTITRSEKIYDLSNYNTY